MDVHLNSLIQHPTLNNLENSHMHSRIADLISNVMRPQHLYYPARLMPDWHERAEVWTWECWAQHSTLKTYPYPPLLSPFTYPSNVEKKKLCTETVTKPNSKLKLPPPWARGGHFTLCDRQGMMDWKINVKKNSKVTLDCNFRESLKTLKSSEELQSNIQDCQERSDISQVKIIL